jgi:hypothetical protein
LEVERLVKVNLSSVQVRRKQRKHCEASGEFGSGKGYEYFANWVAN